jgi:ATP-dependent RNA helicase DDX46/PRP5
MTAEETAAAAAAAAAAAERKLKRLEAWRKRQQQQQKDDENGPPKGVGIATGGFQTSATTTTEAEEAGKKPKLRIGLETSNIKGRKKKKKKNEAIRLNDYEDDDQGDEDAAAGKSRAGLLGLEELNNSDVVAAAKMQPQQQTQPQKQTQQGQQQEQQGGGDGGGGGALLGEPPPKRRRRGRWDVKEGDDDRQASSQGPKAEAEVAADENNLAREGSTEDGVNDALDAFMMRLEAGDAVAMDDDDDAAMGGPADKRGGSSTAADDRSQPPSSYIDSSGSMVRMARTSVKKADIRALSNAPVATSSSSSRKTANYNAAETTLGIATAAAAVGYTYSDWESDAPATPYNQGGDETDGQETDVDDEEEERARREFIDALKRSAPPDPTSTSAVSSTTNGGGNNNNDGEDGDDEYETKSEVRSEKERREDAVRQLSVEADRLRRQTHVAVDVGRIYNDGEGGVMEEAERTLAALTAAPDALEVLAEMNKKKELRSVDHESVDYLPVRKNLYIVPRSLASLTPTEVAERRARLGVKVRGKGAPAPVSKFGEAGLSERIISLLEKKGITDPFPVQAQCLPCIMAGRDVIGIAKTGSGKTLAFVLPMLRHILDQPPLAPNETGPIGLILAPARELAYQIHIVCKGLAKFLGLKSTAVYGGAGVAEQIGDLKRGTHILCATPGRLIDILTMQSGKLISLQRVSMVCLDESDRAFDMGFEPQISAILAAVRPDRQMVMFSATFPKAVENLAKKSLRSPLEIIVGGRSVASDSVDQYAEMLEEEDKFLRLLQILGEHADGEKKVIVFVGRQEQADSLFEQLTRCGYSSLSIHGGMDQEDRDSNMSDFKRADGPQLLVATSVAGRGLDVPSCGCVVNYSAPNHLEDYVHRVGRTGRANNRGVAYTFVNSTDEAKFAPIVVRALVEAGHSKNLSQDLKDLSESFKEKVAKGEARWANSGYQGKGYTYDSSEISEVQKLAQMEKRQALIEAGLLDPDEEEAKDQGQDDNVDSGEAGAKGRPAASGIGKKDAVGILSNVSADVLAIPGMREALMKKAGMLPADDGPTSMGENHFVEELEINDYPQQARWKVTQKETTSRLQDEFQTAVTLKGQYIESGKTPAEGERKLYLHLEAQSSQILQNCILEIKRLLNEETLRVGARSSGGGGRYSVL